MGRISVCGGVVRDPREIIDRDVAEEALRASETRYRALVERIPAIVCHYTLDDASTRGEVPFRLAFVSPQVCELLGVTQREWVEGGTAFWAEMLHPDDRERVMAENLRTNDTDDDFREEYRMVGRGGQVVWIRDEARLLRDEATGESLWHGVMFDITDFKRVENALRESEGRYRDLVQFSPDAILIYAEGEFVFANAAAAALLGARSSEELVGKPIMEIVHPDYRALVAGRVAEEASGRPVPLVEEKFIRLDGEVIDVEVAGMPFAINGIRGGQIVVRDVTRRKLAEAKLREAEERYRTLVEQIPAVTYTYEYAPADKSVGRTVYVSPQIESILGYSVEEWQADDRLWDGTIDERDRERVVEQEHRTARTGEPFQCEFRRIAANGRVVWVREQSMRVRSEAGEPEAGEPESWQGVMFDITELKLAEEELRESMYALSRLTDERRMLLFRLAAAEEEERARIAADIHDDSIQKMTAVGLRLETLRRQLDGSPQQAALGQLEETVGLAIGRLRHLMFELRPPSLDRDGLAAALEQYLAQFRDETDLEASLSNRLVTEPDGETRIIAYRIAQEAITNVRKHANATRMEVTLDEQEGSLLLRVRDDGVGFSPDEALASRPGHLGLTSIRERAELAGGSLRVESAPGAGTTVAARLPVGPGGSARGDG